MPKQLYFPKLTIQRLVTLAMLIALAVIVSKFSVSIIPNQLVVSFTFIVNTVIGIIAGPFWSFITLAMIDLIDSLMGGTSHFIIWWTVMEAFQGLLYGFFFYKRPLRSNQKKGLDLCVSCDACYHAIFNISDNSPIDSDLFSCSFLGPICCGKMVQDF